MCEVHNKCHVNSSYHGSGSHSEDEPIFRLQLYSILKSDWSGAWLLLPIVTRTVNSIVSAGYSRKIVIMCVKWNLFSKSHSF